MLVTLHPGDQKFYLFPGSILLIHFYQIFHVL